MILLDVLEWYDRYWYRKFDILFYLDVICYSRHSL